MKKWLAIIIAALVAVFSIAWAEEPNAAEPTVQAEETAAPEEETAAPAETEAPDAGDAPEAVPEAEAAPTADAAELPAPEEVEALTTDLPPEESLEIWFEEGFGLSLPSHWVSFPVSEEDQAAGIRYALGDGSGERFLFIQITPTDLQDNTALGDAVDAGETFSKRNTLTFNETPFTTFIDAEANASCCATLWADQLLIFIFTPQSDPDFMLTAPQIMETFTTH